MIREIPTGKTFLYRLVERHGQLEMRDSSTDGIVFVPHKGVLHHCKLFDVMFIFVEFIKHDLRVLVKECCLVSIDNHLIARVSFYKNEKKYQKYE
jgi:hypothetical protein